MRSPLGALLPKTGQPPVSYSTRGSAISTMAPGGFTAALQSTSAVGTMFAVVNRTSNACAQVNWRLYRKSTDKRRRYGPTDDSRTEVTSHRALDVLNSPNQFMTRPELVESVQQHIDLTGEGWLVFGLDAMGWPASIWYVRPDRIEPVTDPTNYLLGYLYTGPGGVQVPLDISEVSMIRMPNPTDPYRGLGPVQALMNDLDATRLAAAWNRNFFVNSAEPGGIIQSPQNLTDQEWKDFTTRWAESHRGVSKAHRIAILEGGMTWVPNAYNQRDMQFVQMRSMNRDTILEAYTMPKSVLGITEDVNRASAEAGEVTFGRWLLVPRLERWKAALNNDFLPKFGPTATNLEFDYDDPIPPDQLTENATLAARVAGAGALITQGVDPAEAYEYVGLPNFTFTKPEPSATIPPTPPTQEAPPAEQNADGEEVA